MPNRTDPELWRFGKRFLCACRAADDAKAAGTVIGGLMKWKPRNGPRYSDVEVLKALRAADQHWHRNLNCYPWENAVPFIVRVLQNNRKPAVPPDPVPERQPARVQRDGPVRIGDVLPVIRDQRRQS